MNLVYVDGFMSTIAHIRAVLNQTDEPVPVGNAGLEEPTPVGLPHAHPVSAVDVDFPIFDVVVDTLGAEVRYPARLHLVPSDKRPEQFSATLIATHSSDDATRAGLVYWTVNGLSRHTAVENSRIMVRHRGEPGDQVRWLSETGQEITIGELQVVIAFDPRTCRVFGEFAATSTSGDPLRATFDGALRGRRVQLLRREIDFPNASGRWTSTLGPALECTIDAGTAPLGAPLLVRSADRWGLLRFVSSMELLVGLVIGASGEREFVAAGRPEEPVPRPPFDSADREALRFLGQDLLIAHRPAEARPLLDRARRLIEDAVLSAATSQAERTEHLSLVMLLNAQVACAFRLRNYPVLLRHLERAVVLREQLSSTSFVRNLVAQIAGNVNHGWETLEGVQGIAHELRRSAELAGDPCGPAAAALAEVLETAPGLAHGVQAALANVAALTHVAERDHSVSDGWTPETVGIRPFCSDQAAMPAQDRARRDQAMPAQHRGQSPDQRGEHRSICPVQAGFRVGSASHGEFVAPHQELDVLGCRGAGEQHQQVQQPEDDQVEQTQRHGARSFPADRAVSITQASGTSGLLEPHGKPRGRMCGSDAPRP